MWSKNEKNLKAYHVLGSTVQKDLFQKHCGKFINPFIVIFTYEDNALPMFFPNNWMWWVCVLHMVSEFAAGELGNNYV